MRYTKILLLSTLSTVALLTAVTTSRAFESTVTDMGLLRPQHDVWQVGSVNTQNTSYCAMVNQYDKEISLAFARNPAGYGSLALDFPGEILQTGMSYPVTLQVDDLEARQFNVRASSNRSIIVQIGQDEDFYSALGGNGTLRITLPTVDMRFDLKKFSGSYISLVSCADKLPQHEGPRTAAIPVPPVEKSPLTVAAATTTVATAPKASAAVPSAPIALIAQKPAAIIHGTQQAPAINSVPATPPVTVAQAVHGDDIQWEMEAVRQSLHEKGINTAESKSPAVVAAQQNSINATGTKLASANKPGAAAPLHRPDIIWSSQKNDEELAEENIELRNKLDLLKAEKDGLQAKLDMQDKQSRVLEAALSGKESDLSSVRTLSIEDSKSLAEVQAELINLKRGHAQDVADLQTKLAEAAAQYDTLQRQFTDDEDARRSAETQAAQSQTELDLVRQRLSQTSAQLAAIEQQKNAEDAQIQSQGAESKNLYTQMKDELERTREQAATLENQMMSVTMQRDDLASQLAVETRQNNQLQIALEVKEREQQTSSLSGDMDPASSGLSPTLSQITPAGGVSSSEGGYLPAIRPHVRGQTDENWNTVVIQ